MKLNFLSFFVLLLVSNQIFAQNKHDLDLKLVNVCDDIDEWPPYTYYKRINKTATSEIVGYSVDFLNSILKFNNLKADYTLLPWPRCLEGVKNGTYDLALNASLSPEREKEFLISDPYYVLTESYIFKKSKPEIKITTTADFKKRKICGQDGYNYTYMGIQNTDILYSVKSLDSAVKMIKSDRCDLIPVNNEVLVGYKAIGNESYLDDKDLQIDLIPGVPGTKYYMFFNKTRPKGLQLKKLVNDGILKNKNSKFLKDLSQKYNIKI